MRHDVLIDEDAMLTQAEAARALSVSRQLVRDWCLRKAERIKSEGEGRNTRYRYGDLLDIESETRSCRRPGTFERKRQLVAA